MLITGGIALLVFALIIIGSALIAYWYKDYSAYDKGMFHSFIVILSGLSIIITLLFYYSVLELQVQQQELLALQEFTRLNDTMLNSILTSIHESATIIPNFVHSITPLSNLNCCNGSEECNISLVEDTITVEACTQKALLSYRIFSFWQDIAVSSKCTRIDYKPYIINFLQKANSPQLYSQWKISKINFSANTQQFGDMLFDYALPITIQIPEEYNKAAEKLMTDPSFYEIVRKSR